MRGTRRAAAIFVVLTTLLVSTVLLVASPASAAGAIAFEKTVVEPAAGTPLGSGDLVTYELKVTCLSLESPCGSLNIADQLPPELDFVSAAVPAAEWTQTQTGQTVSIGDPNFLDGETAIVLLRARVASGLSDGTTITNNATATISDPAPGTPPSVSDSVAVEITEGLTPAWVARKVKERPSGDPRVDSAGQSEVVRYRIEVCATSGSNNVDLNDIVLVDTLPPNATLVTPFSGTGWTFDQASLTWSRDSLAVDDLYAPNDARTLTRCSTAGAVDVRYNGVAAGDTGTNTLTSTGEYGSGQGPFGQTSTPTVTFRAQTDAINASKNGPGSVNPGGAITWSLTADPADFDVTNLVMEDLLTDPARPLWPVETIRSGSWSGGFTATVEARVDGTYQALGTSTGSNVTWTTLANGTPLAGTAIDAVRWTFAGTIPATFSFGQAGQIVQRVPLTATEPSVNNCVDATAISTQIGAPLVREACRTVTIVPLSLTPNFSKSVTAQKPGALRPGDFVDVTLRFNTSGPGNDAAINPILTDLLPPELRFSGFDPNPEPPSTPTGSYTPGPINTALYSIVAETEVRDGRDLVRFRWVPNPNNPTPPIDPLVIPPPPSSQISVTFVARVQPGTPRGTYTNTGGVTANNAPTACPSGGSPVVEDLAGTGSPQATCKGSANFGVVAAAIMDAEKYSLGDAALGNVDPLGTVAPEACPVPNPPFTNATNYTRFPCVGQVLAERDFFFRIVLTNTGNQPLNNYIAYDVLPYEPDTGVSETLQAQPRATEWVPVLLDPVTLVAIPSDTSVVVPPDAVIEYSASSNPCRPEMSATSNETGWQASCDDDWSTDLPGGAAENVKAWRLVVPFAQGAWQPAQRMVLDIHMQAPSDALPGEITWNSVAHRSSDAVTGSRLPTAEPRKVGIRVPASSLGGTAFRDVNRDGILDDDDERLPGITARLLDEDGNELATTTTLDDGTYVFPSLPPGTYRVAFDKATLPPGQAIVPPGEGDDPAVDSDPDPISGETPLIDLPPNVDDLTYNIGVRERITDLRIAKSVDGTLTEDSGTYLIEVVNDGEDPTGGPIAFVDTLPPGLTYAGTSGEGWACTATGQSVDCVYAGLIAAAAAYPPLRIAVDVTAAPGENVTNSVAVFEDPSSDQPTDETSVLAVVVDVPDPPVAVPPPAAGAPAPQPAPSGSLPLTGGGAAVLLLGAALVALGGLLWTVSRRRPSVLG